MNVRKVVGKELEVIANELVALASRVLDSDVGVNVKVGRNTLQNSALKGDLEKTIKFEKGDDPVICALFNHYVVYLEWNRPPRYKRMPPISALKGWAEKNGVPTDADTLWRISYAIWRDGHAGRPIFATMDKVIEGGLMDEWQDKLYNAILVEFNKHFSK